jgi:hypothetical protein
MKNWWSLGDSGRTTWTYNWIDWAVGVTDTWWWPMGAGDQIEILRRAVPYLFAAEGVKGKPSAST